MTDATTTDTATADTGGESLDQLAIEAGRMDSQPTQAAQAQAEEQRAVVLSTVQTNTGELHAALAMAKRAALPILAMVNQRKAAALAVIWSDDALKAIAEAGGEVLALHGIKLSNLAGGFGPYVSLALAVGPVAYGTHAILTAPEPKPAEVVSDGQQQ